MTFAEKDLRVLSFDCYGTLIDWETGIWDAFQPALMAAGRRDITRERLLAAYADAESAIENACPDLAYDAVLAAVHERLCRHFALTGITDEMHEAFAESIRCWPAFADTADALRALAGRFRLVILSNVHRAGIEASLRRLGTPFDAVLIAADIGSYKPDPENFRRLLALVKERFGAGPDNLLHVAQSLYHDIVPATRLGIACAWIDRQNLRHGGGWGATPRVKTPPEGLEHIPAYPTLAALARALGCPPP
jgi:2-haloalkanoic acid dehalogenase type II